MYLRKYKHFILYVLGNGESLWPTVYFSLCNNITIFLHNSSKTTVMSETLPGREKNNKAMIRELRLANNSYLLPGSVTSLWPVSLSRRLVCQSVIILAPHLILRFPEFRPTYIFLVPPLNFLLPHLHFLSPHLHFPRTTSKIRCGAKRNFREKVSAHASLRAYG